MSISTIYIPSGRAKEYGDYALNIFSGCSHGCDYCFAPNVIKKTKQDFHNCVEPRKDIVAETKKYLDKHTEIKGKHIHLCFTCDPFPVGYEQYWQITYDIIDIIHNSGNYVQILTKSRCEEELLKHLVKEDIFGITISCGNKTAKVVEPKASTPTERLDILFVVKYNIGCKTFVSCEPVLETEPIYYLIKNFTQIDGYKIGKLNYHKLSEWNLTEINWGEFGKECERLCKEYNRNYYIKESLRKEMGEA